MFQSRAERRRREARCRDIPRSFPPDDLPRPSRPKACLGLVIIMMKCMYVCLLRFCLSPEVFHPNDLPRPSRPKAGLGLVMMMMVMMINDHSMMMIMMMVIMINKFKRSLTASPGHWDNDNDHIMIIIICGTNFQNKV